MKPKSKLLFLTATLASSVAVAEPCFGPGGCSPTPAEPITGPAELCLSAELGCVPVLYTKVPVAGAWFAIASASVSGYPTLGWSGPCFDGAECPAIYNQAFGDLSTQAVRASRVLRFAP